MKTSFLGLIIVMSLTGCARNTILEGELLLPEAPEGMSIMVSPKVVWASAADFVQPNMPNEPLRWLAGGFPIVPLSQSRSYKFSVESDDLSEKGNPNVHMRVLFCSNPTCIDLSDPLAEVWFVLNEPFHEGVSSSIVLEIPEIPVREGGTATWPSNCTRQDQVMLGDSGDFRGIWKCNIDRCQFNACGGDESATTFCDDSGQHFCDAE